MRITDKALRSAVMVRLVEGSLNTFVEKEGTKELRIGYGTIDKTNGEGAGLSRRQFVILMRKVVAVAKQNNIASLALDWKHIKSLLPHDAPEEAAGEIAAVAFVMANYEHNTYKTKPKEGWSMVTEVAIQGASLGTWSGVHRGEVIGAEVNACRELCNTPGGDMTPKLLANAAKTAVKGTKATVVVLGQKEMGKLGMGAVLGIAKGSIEEPQFIIVEYKGGAKNEPPVVFVGKGVTFDTGGLNIKPGDHMYEMHMDMSGGAAVIHAVVLAAKLNTKANVVALVPAVENNLANNAVRPGDILRSMSGKTIEVLNTDAEGRVILADGITYAKKYHPAAVVDVATLTGAALTALGTVASAFMSNDKNLNDMLEELGEQSGDYVWPFPLWEEYDEMVKGTFGDVPNISTMGNSRYGGVIAGGKFLEVFAKELDCPWAHLDIAPKMTSTPSEQLAKGATGVPVRLLLALIESYAP
ncbi:MAG: leucyl aminopeptidase family protein [Minisyncoccia bacterium]|jgi:leucyl aminopeptidase